jgi:hypothetical protein
MEHAGQVEPQRRREREGPGKVKGACRMEHGAWSMEHGACRMERCVREPGSCTHPQVTLIDPPTPDLRPLISDPRNPPITARVAHVPAQAASRWHR